MSEEISEAQRQLLEHIKTYGLVERLDPIRDPLAAPLVTGGFLVQVGAALELTAKGRAALRPRRVLK